MRRLATIALVGAVAAGCSSAAGSIAPEALGVSARDAYIEARSMARSWSADARLRWVQGEGIDTDGLALPDRGSWAFHYTAPGTAIELVVGVSPLTTTSEERAPTSPPGLVIGNATLDAAWVDSPEAIDGLGSAPEPPLSLLLVPTRPPEWRIRGEAGRWWRVHAETGEALTR